MTLPTAVQVTVPATTANIGPGFDCMGAALTLHNQFEFKRLDNAESGLEITVDGPEAERVQRNERNLACRAFKSVFEALGQPQPPLALHVNLGIPLSRGLGSSATAIVAGLCGANQLAGSPFSEQDLLGMAIAIEGHPDNVVPAMLGGCQLTVEHTNPAARTICPVQWAPTLTPIVLIPDFELSTHAARQVLPAECSYLDAIFNAAHVGLLIKSLESGNGQWLKAALDDRLHQPYRHTLIPGYAALHRAALDAGALGLVISGAGPTLLILSQSDAAPAVVDALPAIWADHGIHAIAKILKLDQQGVKVVTIS